MRNGRVSGLERPGMTVGWNSCNDGGKAHCRQGSEGIETPVFMSLFVESVSVSREIASVTEGCDHLTAARLRY